MLKERDRLASFMKSTTLTGLAKVKSFSSSLPQVNAIAFDFVFCIASP